MCVGGRGGAGAGGPGERLVPVLDNFFLQPESLDELFDLVSGGCSCLVRARAKKTGNDTLHWTGKER